MKPFIAMMIFSLLLILTVIITVVRGATYRISKYQLTCVRSAAVFK